MPGDYSRPLVYLLSLILRDLPKLHCVEAIRMPPPDLLLDSFLIGLLAGVIGMKYVCTDSCLGQIINRPWWL